MASNISNSIQPIQQRAPSVTSVTNAQMYLAFSAEHLGDAIHALEKAIAEQPHLLAHWNDVLAGWRAQLRVLQAEAR